MQFNSHYIWESGSEEKENPVSVVLQQVSFNNHHCLLACVCDGDKSNHSGSFAGDKSNFGGSFVSGYFTERLVEWFHHHALGILQKKRGADSIWKALSMELNKIETELLEYSRQKSEKVIYDVMGILLYDHQCWIFGQGECRGYLFNRRYNRKQRRHLPVGNGQEMELIQGRVQKNIGIMICNIGFGAKLLEAEMLQVMFEEHLTDNEIQKRLRELWREDMVRGNRQATGAVYIQIE